MDWQRLHDRFVYLESWKRNEPGWIITKPFQLDGNQLELNANASHGSLKVEILDAEGNTIPGYSAEEAIPWQHRMAYV
ncbi:MAG: hypothetical protein R3C11_10530 [Planctomycetaceae bacterium]